MATTPTLVPATVPVRAYMADSADGAFHPGEIKRRELRDTDVSIKIHYCGICHTDIHMKKNEWGMVQYPVVPGHEVAGVIDAVGSKVTKFKIGDRVGVGCIVNSCQTCGHCNEHLENYCESGMTMTYSYPDKISGGYTYGGYSERIVVEDRYVLSIPDNLELSAAAPLLCAGITSYSPLIDANIGPKSRVGILGIGGLGHLGIRLAKALGAYVVGFTSKEEKRAELKSLGADEVVVTSIPSEFEKVKNSLNLIIDTVSADHELGPYVDCLVFRGTYSVVGAPVAPLKIAAFTLIMKAINLTGSAIGSIERTQNMLDLCAEKGVAPLIEIGQLKDVDALYTRLEKGDVRYRFVLDIKAAYGSE